MKQSKRLLTTLLTLAIVTMASAYNYAPNSVLSQGTFRKIKVQQNGLYKISNKDLRSWGLDPATVQVYGYGGVMLKQNFNKQPFDDLPIVPVLRLSDGIVFYGQGYIGWDYNGSRFTHTTNTYSDYGYYFLSSAAGSTQEITEAQPISGTVGLTVSTYQAYLVHELDSVNLVDRTGKEGGGRDFYGEQINNGKTRTIRMTLPSPIVNNSQMSVYANVAGCSSSMSSFTFTIEGQQSTINAQAIPAGDFYTRGVAATLNHSYNAGTSQQKEIQIRYESAAATGIGFLNYIELTATCSLALVGNEPLLFRSTQSYGSASVVQYQLSGADNSTQVWDITNRANIVRIPTTLEGNTLTFNGQNRNEVHEYVAFNPSSSNYLTALDAGQVSNQNLHALSDIDMVIISHPNFLSEAQRLGMAHQQVDGFNIAVVTTEQVYNEFSSGTPDATAYRWLMKMLYDRAKASGGTIQAPRYLLLFGDGTFDNRKRLVTSGNNWILTYQAKNSLHEVKAYATDDYFGFLDNNEGDYDITGRMDIGVGRLPVNTEAEAQGVVSKLIRHMQNANKGRWKNQLVFVADDGNHNLHTQCSDNAAEALRLHAPDFIVNKIYLDAYQQEVNASGESYPSAESRLNNLLKNGLLLFDYCGHSGYNNASNEGLISSAKVRNMQNENCGLWVFASCSFSLFDAGLTSVGEEAVLNPNGGALAVCSTNRTVYANQNSIFNRHLCDSLFAHRSPYDYPNRLGDALRLAKNATGSDENKMSYTLLGDPAISLQLPTQYQVVTTLLPDTLNAMSINNIEGFLQSEDGDTATWFNGKLYITLFDKLQQIKTFDNDEVDPNAKVTFTYNDRPNILFQGETDVVNGKFSTNFMVAKDIRYNFGTGRLAYYAYDTTTGEEGIGNYEQFIVGGSSPIMLQDTIGPEIQLYINSPSFQNGDKSNETPHFFAELYDEHGINTAGSGIGHDMILIVDDKASETYVLNDYFSIIGNFQQGIVSFAMPEMKEGRHEAFFRAWDLLNNSSSATIQFEVVKGLQPNIFSVTSYPNPVSADGMLQIEVDYNQPDVIMQTDIFIYDLSGRLVHQLSQRGTDNITWNLEESHATSGVYLYKVQLSSPTTKTVSKTGKLIITK